MSFAPPGIPFTPRKNFQRFFQGPAHCGPFLYPHNNSLSMSEEKTKPAAEQQDNPLADILVNVLAPVLILSKCSKDGESFWHLGPYLAMGLALSIPLLYGIWHFTKVKKVNLFSAVGLANVLLTGVITIYLYSSDDPSRRTAAPYLLDRKSVV